MDTVVTRGLSKRYGDRVILQPTQLRLSGGGLHVLAGRSGSGKSTLLALLAGLRRPTSGTVEIKGQDLFALDPDERAAFRLRNIGLVFQDFRLVPDLTAIENVALPLKLAGRRRGARNQAWRLLDRVGMLPRVDAFPENLSGGEQQRVAIARALAVGPALVLADEPTANLDEENARLVLTLLRSVANADCLVLIASHDPIATEFADQLWKIADGSLLPSPATTGARAAHRQDVAPRPPTKTRAQPPQAAPPRVTWSPTE